MEFDHLQGFYYVAKLGSFTEAAGHLYLSQPAISLQVKALENEIGERLFDRVGRSIRLTAAGRILYRHVEELITKLNEIHRTIGEIKQLERGQIYIGASDTTSMYFLPSLLKAFLKMHSKIELCITSLISAQVVRKVLERELDLGIVTLAETPGGLETIPLFRERMVCIATPDHPLSSRKIVDVTDIASEPLIALEKQSLTRQEIDRYFRQAGCEPSVMLELSNFEIIKSYVAAGLGISLVPEAAVARAYAGLAQIPLHKPPSVEVGIVYRKDKVFSQPAVAFLAMARQFFGGPLKQLSDCAPLAPGSAVPTAATRAPGVPFGGAPVGGVPVPGVPVGSVPVVGAETTAKVTAWPR